MFPSHWEQATAFYPPRPFPAPSNTTYHLSVAANNNSSTDLTPALSPTRYSSTRAFFQAASHACEDIVHVHPISHHPSQISPPCSGKSKWFGSHQTAGSV